MSKIEHFFGLSLISSIIGVISEFFGSLETAYITLLFLISIDTIVGIASARKLRRFSSKKLRRCVRKIITYSIAILSVRLLEVNILAIYETTIPSNVTIAFLAINETISIFENLTVLGVPLPHNFILMLLHNTKSKNGDNPIWINEKTTNYASEIEDIVNYQVSSFNDTQLKRLLEVKFDVWKSIVLQIDIMYNTIGENTNNDHIYYQTISLLYSGIEEIKSKWVEEGIPNDYIVNFNSGHQSKVDEWLNHVKTICYSEASVEDKRKQIIDSIIIILYKTVVDAHKSK